MRHDERQTQPAVSKLSKVQSQYAAAAQIVRQHLHFLVAARLRFEDRRKLGFQHQRVEIPVDGQSKSVD